MDICASLEARGHVCWIAPRNLRGGHEYADEIIRGIESSRCLVLVLSEAANESTFVRREVERAVSKRKPVFPIRIEEVLPSPSLELFVSATHWIDAWSGQLVEHVDRLAVDMSDEGTLQKGAQISSTIARKRGGWLHSPTVVASVAIGAILLVALAALALMKQSLGGGGHHTYPTPQYPSADQMAQIEQNAQRSADEQIKASNAHSIRQRVSSSGTKLNLVSGSESSAPDVYESVEPSSAYLDFTPLCSPEATSIQYTFDEGGYFVQAANPNGFGVTPPFVIRDLQGGKRLKIKVTVANGEEIGPFEYEVPERGVFLLQKLKADFQTLMPQAINCVKVPYGFPAGTTVVNNEARNPVLNLQLIAYRVEQPIINAGFKVPAPDHIPVVLCAIPPNAPALTWLAVKEIHVATSPGGQPVIQAVKQDWDLFLQAGTSSLGNQCAGADQWQVELPPDTTSVYATYFFRDGTQSEEVRYNVSTLPMQPPPTAAVSPGDSPAPAAAAASVPPAAAPAPTASLAVVSAPTPPPEAAPSPPANPLQAIEAQANAGDANAQNQLGMLYQTGSGVPIDYAASRQWYEKAAAQNLPIALQNLARLYAQGMGMPKDYATALKYYERAANLGLSGAESDVGVMYSNGWGTPVDNKRAVFWLEKASDQGEAEADNALGKLYLMGTGVNRDYARAIDLFRKSSDAGDANGENALGVMYMSGIGVPKDLNKARQLFQQSAGQGNVIAQANLLRCQ